MKAFIGVLTWVRGFLLMLFVVPWTVSFSIFTLICCFIGLGEFAYKLDGRIWGKGLLWLMGAHWDIRGVENLPNDGRGYLFLFNHTSYVDIIVMLAALPKVPKFGAKIELFKIPFFGAAMSALGTLKITRESRQKVLKLYEEAKSRVEAGEVFALAPEGTRQSGGELGRFKKGPFLFAIHSEMPVVPLLIVGAEQIQPKGNFMMGVGRKWIQPLVVQILPPVQGRDYSQETISEFQEQVRASMEPQYKQIQQELNLKFNEYRP